MTTVEDRLTGALAARADQVQPEDLRPEPRALDAGATRPPRRHPLAWALAAAACAAVVAAPFVLGGGDRTERPTPPVSTASATPFPGRVATADGDVDGDGRADEVRVSPGGALEVALASGEVLRTTVPGHGRLLGLADVGGARRVVALGPSAGRATGQVRVVGEVAGALAVLRTAGGALLAEDRDQTTWVDDTGLWSGLLPSGDRRVMVSAQRWTLAGGRLRSGDHAAYLCWDRRADAHPRPCAKGEFYGPEVGSAAGLPRLFPESDLSWLGLGQELTAGGTTYSLRGRVSPDGVAAGDVELVARTGDTVLRAPVPAGWPPSLASTVVDTGDGYGVVVSQEGGDSDTWTVYVRSAGTLVAAHSTSSRVRLGGGFSSDGNHAVLSWTSADGDLYTREGIDAAGRRSDVWSWSFDGTAMTPHDLGTVCLDLAPDPPRYGTC